MDRLSDITTRKFIESYPVKNRTILTHDGYKPIKNINKTIVYEVWQIKLENGLELKCADTHIVISIDFEEIYAMNSLGYYLNTIYGPSKVISVENLKTEEHMYDIEVDSDDNLYYSDGILSHNTTLSRIFILWSVLFGKDINFGIAANKQVQAKEVLDGIKMAYMNLPLWLQQGVKAWNAHSLQLENGGRLKISATSASAFRGMSFAASYVFTRRDGTECRIASGLYCDEVAFVQKNIWDEFRNSVIPTISSGKHGKIIYTSTPQGMNHFYKIWIEAKEGRNGFFPRYIPYWEHPGKDEEWATQKRKELGSDVAFQQEHGCSFEGSSFTLIDGKKFASIVSKTPIQTKLRNFNINIYVEPIPGHYYVLGVDTAKYGEGDFLSVQVLDVTSKPFVQVATFRQKNMTYLNLVEPLYYIGTYYNNAQMFIENNSGDGQSTADLLVNNYDYENVYAEKAEIFGFRTTTKSRRIGLQNFKQLIEDDMLILNDEETIAELMRFALKGGKYQATDGYNDDAVMATVAALYFLQLKNFVDIEDLHKFFNQESTEEDDESMFVFGFISDETGAIHSF